MSSCTRNICCAYLFIVVFFDAGNNRWRRKDILSLAHHTKNNVETPLAVHMTKEEEKYAPQNYDTQQWFMKEKKNKRRKQKDYFGTDMNIKMKEDENKNEFVSVTSKYIREDDADGQEEDNQKTSTVLNENEWPKFDVIMKLTNRYYDWKKDRWRKYRKKSAPAFKLVNKHFRQTLYGNRRKHLHSNYNVNRRNRYKFNDSSSLYHVVDSDYALSIEEEVAISNKNINFISKTIKDNEQEFTKQTNKSVKSLGLKTECSKCNIQTSQVVRSGDNITARKNFHFSTVKMKGDHNSRNIVVAVSVTIPKKKPMNTYSDRKTHKPKLNKTSVLKLKDNKTAKGKIIQLKKMNESVQFIAPEIINISKK